MGVYESNPIQVAEIAVPTLIFNLDVSMDGKMPMQPLLVNPRRNVLFLLWSILSFGTSS